MLLKRTLETYHIILSLNLFRFRFFSSISYLIILFNWIHFHINPFVSVFISHCGKDWPGGTGRYLNATRIAFSWVTEVETF